MTGVTRPRYAGDVVRVLAVADEIAPRIYDDGVRDLAPQLVLAAGDLPWDYLEFLADCLDVPVVFVPGNHDPAITATKQTRRGVHVRDGVVCDAPRPHGAINADRAIVSIGGLTIAGLGGCVRYRPGPHQYSQREYHRAARRLVATARKNPTPVDVLLTHAPPLGLGDGADGPHVGIEALHEVVDVLRPTWHLHGHIHPYGQPQPDRLVGDTCIRNVIPWNLIEIESTTAVGHGT